MNQMLENLKKVVYIRKVKKSESKSQHSVADNAAVYCCVYP